MSIDRLRYFAAVVETRSLRKAAEFVGISAPSMSKAIAVLEAELGHKLLHAEGRGIGITVKGLEVYRLSSSLIEENRRFYDNLNRRETQSARIRLATFEVFSTYFISAFLKQEPDAEILLLEMGPGKIEESILNGLVDVGITYVPSPHTALEYREVGTFQMGIFGTEHWKEKNFLDWAFAVPTTQLNIHSSNIESLDLWPKTAPKRRIKYQFELLETALQTSRRGQSVLHCPDFIVRLHNEYVQSEFRLKPLAPPPGYKQPKAVKTYLVGKKGALEASLERKMAKLMRANHSK